MGDSVPTPPVGSPPKGLRFPSSGRSPVPPDLGNRLASPPNPAAKIPGAMTQLATIRILAAISLALALACVVLAVRYAQMREVAVCWRAAAEDRVAPEGDCVHIR